MNKKRVVSAIIAVVLSFSVFTGCTDRETVQSNGDVKELSLFMHFFGYCVYKEDWPIFKKAAELTGIRLKGVATESISDSSQAWNTMIASKVLPDIIHGSKNQLNDLGAMGGLIPLEDLIETDAPNIKKFLDECPEAKIAATSSDGHIYYIPGSLSGIDKEAVASKGWFIRTDWLEKLGLSTPTTLEEFYNVLKAFKENDPNGNGEPDEIPYFNRQEGIQDLFQLFGANSGWHEDENGRLVNGLVEESYKNAVREIAKWYSEGLIDTEIYSRGQQTREQLLSKNVGGCTHDWFSSTGKYNDTYKKDIPGFKFEAIIPPADVNGIVKEERSRSVLHGLGWGISKDNKHVKETIKYLDFWMSKKGRELNAFGVEGEHYTVKNGKKVFTDKVLSSPDGVSTYMRNQGQVEIGTVGDISAEVSGMNEISKKGFEMYENGGFVKKEFVSPSFNEEENDIIGSIGSDIYTYMKEMEQKWILGTSDVDADWDTYISTINGLGYDTWEKIYNDAYEREKKLLKR